MSEDIKGPRRIAKTIDLKARQDAKAKLVADEMEGYVAERIYEKARQIQQAMKDQCGFSPLRPMDPGPALEKFMQFAVMQLAIQAVCKDKLVETIDNLGQMIATQAVELATLRNRLFPDGVPTDEQLESLAVEHAPPVGGELRDSVPAILSPGERYEPCDTCRGSGMVMMHGGDPKSAGPTDCPDCGGEGAKVIKNPWPGAKAEADAQLAEDLREDERRRFEGINP